MLSLNQNNFLKHEVDVNPSFDIENAHRDRVAKLNSLWITVTIHGLLLLLFLYVVLKPPFPPLSESGVFLNLGLVEVGSGNIQPEGNAEQLKAPTPAASSTSPQQKNEKILTQETKEDVPVISKKENVKKNPAPIKNETKSTATKKNPPAESPPQPKAKALYPGTQANNSTSEGTGNVKGDQGKPNGDVKGTDYSGNPGIGSGGKGGLGNSGEPQLGMSGRKIIFFPTILDNSQKTGRVVVNIKVDKQGNVIWAKATQKGSTTTDSYLFQLAEEAALKTKVNDDPAAAEEQFGTITYSFRVK
jgi:outer membrane biosynthesis protein TonB